MQFSVLIPVYNVEKYLNECLRSITEQEFTDYEIILIDDGSTDTSGEICDAYKKNYANIRVIHQENHGPLYTRRVGFKAAVGEYCIAIDSDDFVGENFFSTLNKAITACNPDMLIINAVKYYDGKTYRHKAPMYSDDKYFEGSEKKALYKKLLNREMSNTLWTKVVKRSIVDVDFDYSSYQGVSMGEDLLQSLPLLTNAASVFYIKEPLYYYRTNLESLTQKYKIETYASLVQVNKKLDEYVMMWNVSNGEVMASNRFMVDVYDIFVSSTKTRDKVVFEEVLKEISYDKYFRKKYVMANKKSMSIQKRFVVWSIYKRTKLQTAMARCLVLLIEWYKFKNISGGKNEY